MGLGKNSGGLGRWLAGIGLSAALMVGPVCWASPQRWGGGRGVARSFQSHEPQEHHGQERGQAERGQGRSQRPPPPARKMRRGPQSEIRRAPESALQRAPQSELRGARRQPEVTDAGRPGAARPAYRRGQEHLPAWWQAHRELSPQKQAEALRRQPGFQSLPRGQQQRLIQRLREFDRRPPQQQRRMLDRVEMFEHLSPERQQEVRGASQALSQMPSGRQRVIRQAFHQLRQMPPDQRREMLHSGYGAQFTPQERTVLENLLSIEPYQSQGQIPQPYFGKR